MSLKTHEDIARCVRKVVDETPVLDVHTHIYPPSFGGLLLWGIDELITYHYLVAEAFRRIPPEYDAFYARSKREQVNDLISPARNVAAPFWRLRRRACSSGIRCGTAAHSPGSEVGAMRAGSVPARSPRFSCRS